jgi:hypothetical protein
MNLVPIKVDILDLSNWRSILKQARELTRPNSTEPTEELLKLDAPIGDLPSVVLCFQAPILLREVITSFRDIGVWSQSTRVLDLNNWDIAEQVSKSEMDRIDGLKRWYNHDLQTMSQDQARMWLPTAHVSKFVVRMSLRTLVKLYRYFNELAEYATGSAKDAVVEMSKELYRVQLKIYNELDLDVPFGQYLSEEEKIINGIRSIPFLEDLIRSINYVEVLHPLTDAFGTKGDKDTISICTTMSIAMRAQIIRHRMFQVADDFKLLFKCDNILATPIREEIRVKITASASVWREVARTRNCWLAQGELWSPILREVNKYLGDENLPLPCTDGTCSYHAECMKRINCEEPGLPCPRHILLRNKMGDPQPAELFATYFNNDEDGMEKSYRELETYAIESHRPHPYWLRQINAIKEL